MAIHTNAPALKPAPVSTDDDLVSTDDDPVSTDDDPVDTPRQTAAPRPSARLSLPTAVAQKPLPRPEPTENRVVKNRIAKPEPVESKGGSAPRSLKLSGGTEEVALSEPLAAATARSGQSISLQVASPVVVKGELIIPQGAAVQGEVISVSTDGKKDMLEIHIQHIHVGGQRVGLKGGTFRYVGNRNEPLLFRSGQQFMVYTAGAHRFSL